jgi:hypothetical protein
MTHDDAIKAALLALAEAFKANMTRGRGDPEDFEEQARHFPRVILDAIQNNQTDQLGVQHELVTLPAPVLIQLVADALRAPVLVDHLRQSKAEADGWVTGWRNYRKPIRERQRGIAKNDRKRTPDGDLVTKVMLETDRATWQATHHGQLRGWASYAMRKFGIKNRRTLANKLNATE